MEVCTINNTKNLHNYFPENFELQFYKIFRKLKNLGCDYFYFLGLDSGISYRFCTNDNWMSFYRDEKFVLNDPLKRIVETTNFIITPWNQITHLHGSEKKTMQGRISYGLFNGLTITREFRSRKYIITLATEMKEHDLARYFLLEKLNHLENFVYECMQLFDQYLTLMFKPVSQELFENASLQH